MRRMSLQLLRLITSASMYVCLQSDDSSKGDDDDEDAATELSDEDDDVRVFCGICRFEKINPSCVSKWFLTTSGFRTSNQSTIKPRSKEFGRSLKHQYQNISKDSNQCSL